MTRVLLVAPELGRPVDGIADYAGHVADELGRQGLDAAFLHVPRTRVRRELLRRLAMGEAGVVFLQYNPFSWGRRGFAPRLLLDVLVLRLRRRRVRVVLGVHEAFVPISDVRSLVLGLWQRVQLRLLLALGHSAVGMTEHLVARLRRMRPRRAVAYVPVGSNLPDASGARLAARGAGGLTDRLVIATMSTGHDSQLGGLVAEAASAIAARATTPVVVLLLGGGNAIDPAIGGVERVISPGFLDAPALARAVASADVFLLPVVDGASTRRGSLMAALQHGVPVVSTLTDRTDAVLRESAALALAQDGRAFVALACATALEPERRRALGEAGRELFARRFAWRAICDDLRPVLVGPEGS